MTLTLSHSAGRGAFGGGGGQSRDMPDAPRGPAATRAGRQPKEPSTPSQTPQEKTRTKEKEDKKTLSDFKIVGLEVPELEWKWGLVPERERERDDEADGSSGRKRKAEGGNEGSCSASEPFRDRHNFVVLRFVVITRGQETIHPPPRPARQASRRSSSGPPTS